MCVPEHRVDAALRIELTHDNVKLPTLKPKVETAAVAFEPNIEEDNVKWVGCRSMVTCGYYDNTKEKWRTKSFTVTPSDNSAEYKERANRMAQACQRFFDLHHSEPPANESSDESSNTEDGMAPAAAEAVPIANVADNEDGIFPVPY